MQCQLQHSIGRRIAHDAIGRMSIESAVAVSTRSDDDLCYALRWVIIAVRILWQESLIVMVMSVEHEVRMRVVQVRPDVAHFAVPQAPA